MGGFNWQFTHWPNPCAPHYHGLRVLDTPVSVHHDVWKSLISEKKAPSLAKYSSSLHAWPTCYYYTTILFLFARLNTRMKVPYHVANINQTLYLLLSFTQTIKNMFFGREGNKPVYHSCNSAIVNNNCRRIQEKSCPSSTVDCASSYRPPYLRNREQSSTKKGAKTIHDHGNLLSIHPVAHIIFTRCCPINPWMGQKHN